MILMPINSSTPLDRPIIVFARSDDLESWPSGVQSCVVEWHATRMKKYMEKNKRPGDPEYIDQGYWDYWSMKETPQGSIDDACGFTPTHWCEIPEIIE